MLENILETLRREINYENNVADKLIRIDELLSYLNEKKAEIRNQLGTGEYVSRDGTKVNIKYIQRHAIDINKYFAYMLKKGKMKEFINSVKVTITNAHHFIDNKEIRKFEYVETDFKSVSIKRD